MTEILIPWQEASKENVNYKLIFDREPEARKHPIIKDCDGVYRWQSDSVIRMLYEARECSEISGNSCRTTLDLNALAIFGPGKNDPRMRKFYRQLGYSLYGYWEIFYWKVNNINADEYYE